MTCRSASHRAVSLHVAVITDVESRPDLAAKMWIAVDRPRDAQRLIGGERIHRVDENRFDARFGRVRFAVREDGPEKALALARTRCPWQSAYCDEAHLAKPRKREALGGGAA